jgi:hypothetical protein
VTLVWRVLCFLPLAACGWRAGYDEASLACEAERDGCPNGFLCSDDGLCVAQPDAAPPRDGLPQAQTMTFGERLSSDVAGATFDTYLSSGNPDDNKGGKDVFYVTAADTRHALLRFDLSAMPPDAIVVAATLELWTTEYASGGEIRAYRMLESWDEGNQDDAGGVANWTFRSLFVPWSGAGATPPSRGRDVLASIAPDEIDAPYTMALPAGLVQAWLASPGDNFGIALVAASPTGDVGFTASEARQTQRRPELTVTLLP